MLTLILVGVIVGGIWSFTHGTSQKSESESTLSSNTYEESGSEVQATSVLDPAAVRYQFELVHSVEKQISEPGGVVE